MTRLNIASAVIGIALGLGACAGPDVISASEQRIVLNAPDQDRAERHCRVYGKNAQPAGETPLRVTYACR